MDFIQFESFLMELSLKTGDSNRGKSVNGNVSTLKLQTVGC